MTGPVFPAARPPGDDGEHPPSCPCLACIDALIAEVSKPLVIPGPRRDPALADREDDAYTGWLTNRPDPYVFDKPEANRATRGPGTGGGAGRRPTGPGKRRAGGSGKSGDGCARVLTALSLFIFLSWAAVAGVVWWIARSWQ